MDDICIVTQVERRRRWTEVDKLARLTEVDTGGGVAAVAHRHNIARSVLYNLRSQLKAAASLRPPDAEDFMFSNKPAAAEQPRTANRTQLQQR